MILVAGLSPAWQQIMVFDALRSGQVNRAVEVHWCASGKVLNVGRAITQLGGRQCTLSLLGGPTGQAIDHEFARAAIDSRWIWAGSPTRVCTTVLERSSGLVTELVQNAAPIAAMELEAFAAAFREQAAAAEVVVLTGSLPPGAGPTFYRELAQATPVPLILDVRGEELLHVLELQPLLVKPNREELAATLGRSIQDDKELHAAMREINRRGAAWVLVSQGGQAAWLSSLNALYRVDVPAIPVINPIGSGDCLAAGLAVRISQGDDVPAAVGTGMAAAMENARQLLPARIEARRVKEQAAALTATRVG